ncbi:hypothetical protein I3760_13G003700 [Carya illinoinensis]|uniref:Transmembrane protein n=1 Tax=Carya illinoinensis TaxID=32201 RepID=A0A8T1NK53_CARIL|nr:hypothetical protein I3760_13G003700 [Carya illinoinensis]KAG6630228.1 hypothetical protein CIPAW_13G003700 [Carya illinoinensis]
MAQRFSTLALATLFAVVAMFFTFAPCSVLAQEFAPAPAPSLEKGAAAYSAPLSGAVLSVSLFLSVLALLKR